MPGIALGVLRQEVGLRAPTVPGTLYLDVARKMQMKMSNGLTTNGPSQMPPEARAARIWVDARHEAVGRSRPSSVVMFLLFIIIIIDISNSLSRFLFSLRQLLLSLPIPQRLVIFSGGIPMQIIDYKN
jgi:hypothetical protein